MAVVSFARPGDAILAKQKYDGKVVDGSEPLMMLCMTDLKTSLFTLRTAFEDRDYNRRDTAAGNTGGITADAVTFEKDRKPGENTTDCG